MEVVDARVCGVQMGKQIDMGTTKCKHQGLTNGATRDAELRAAVLSGST